MEQWSIQKSIEQYRIDGWGAGFFSVNEAGNVSVSPERGHAPIDLRGVVDDLVRRGIKPPHLIRFNGILKQRAQSIYEAFDKAIAEFDYKGKYILTYPVKVNQQRQVVEAVRKAGNGRGMGLEVGSKPELLAVLSMHDAPKGLLLCNGYKDYSFIKMALMGVKLGKRVFELYREGKVDDADAAMRRSIDPASRKVVFDPSAR